LVALLVLLVGGIGTVAAQTQQVTPKSRMFNIRLKYRYDPMPAEIQKMEFWMPTPFQNDRQRIYNRFIFAAYDPQYYVNPDTGNENVYMSCGVRQGVPMNFTFSFDVEREEDLRNDFRPRAARPTPPTQAEQKTEKALMARWLKPETLMTVDAGVRSEAGKITAGRKKPLEKARAIYDHIVNNMTLLDSPRDLQGAGYGNLAFVLKNMKGDSLDLAAAFVGLCRAEGIPARCINGLKISDKIPEGPLTVYHGWGEFYLEGIGWVPVDPAEGLRNVARRSYYFGALDENRLAISIGRDIQLVPPQAGQPLNYLINPYWEGDGKAMPTPGIEVRFSSLTEIQNKPAVAAPSPAKPLGASPAKSQAP
jgi:transglutaminase-like putative cysteine protease